MIVGRSPARLDPIKVGSEAAERFPAAHEIVVELKIARPP
jgi:hypothetical protein